MWSRYEAGTKTDVLAAELGITARFLRARWRLVGLCSANQRRKREDDRCHPARIYALRVNGKTWDEIATDLGLALGPKTWRMLHNRLRRYCLRAGAKMPYPSTRGRPANPAHPEQ